MTQETRVLRPFAGTDDLQRLLEGLLLHFGTKEVLPGTNEIVDASDLLAAPVSLTRPDAPETLIEDLARAVEPCGLGPSDCELVVVGRARRLKRADILHRSRLDQALDLPIRLTPDGGAPRPDVLQAPFSGCTVSVYIILADDREPTGPLQPHLRGTWLARVDFGLATELGPSGIRVLPLTKELRDQHRLPKNCLRFVDTDDVLASHDGDVVLYLDDQLLGQLEHVSKASPAARSLQFQLYLDVVSRVVLAATAQLADGGDPEPDSLLAQVARSLVSAESAGQHRDAEVDKLLEQARTNPLGLIHLAEAKIKDLRKVLMTTLTGDD